jgi:hypothetical protein
VTEVLADRICIHKHIVHAFKGSLKATF